MILVSYNIGDALFAAVRHVCLQCDSPVLIDVRYLHTGELYHCTYCGLDWRLSPESLPDNLQTIYR